MSPDDLPEDDEDTGLQLPLLGLYADLEAGRGAVLLPDEFHQAEPMVQWRILADWQRGLADLQARLRKRVGGASADEPSH